MKLFIFLLLFLTGCFGTQQDYSTPDEVSISGKTLQVAANSRFMSEIQVVPLGKAPGGERKLRTVGQMIAVANSSGDLTSSQVSWVTLDPALAHELELPLGKAARIGSAYGVTTVAKSYLGDIHLGERVQIYRYGSKQNSTVGTISSILSSPKNEDSNSITFLISEGQDWYPGTNCQVEFPLIQRQAVALSPLSMLHEGLREFVLKEIAPNRYMPEEITVVNETREEVYALGNLVPGDHIIERGAILLKPIVHQIIKSQSGEIHVR
jgi:hypothetical protein